MITIQIIKNSKINIDLDNIVKDVQLKIYNIDTDCHKDLVTAKRILYKWGSPTLPLAVIIQDKKDKFVIYSENEEVDSKSINNRIGLCLEAQENQSLKTDLGTIRKVRLIGGP